METATIYKRKRPVGWGVWSGYVLGQDRHGVWVHTPAGSTFVGHDGLHYGFCEAEQDERHTGHDSVVLLPSRQWFVAHFVHRGRLLAHVDVATPPTRAGGVWTYDDLELDPYLTAGGVYGVEDENEFETACHRGLVSEDERRAAMDALVWIADAMSSREAHLIRAGLNHLRRARALHLTPIHPACPYDLKPR